jgi:transposase-like protein
MNDFTTKLINCLLTNENLNDSIQELFRSELEKAINDLLRVELTGFLKYEKYDRQGFNTGNSRNGSYERKFQTTHGELNLIIPRDRNSEFESPIVPKYERRETRIEEIIVKLFQTGLTNSEIAYIAESLYSKKYSTQTISNITEQIIANVESFGRRTLQEEYAVIYLDATYLPIRRDTVSKEAIHIALGIRMDGTKEILGYQVAPTESCAAWSELLNNFKERGLKKALLFVSDGLTGIEDTILGVYPKVDIQRCLVHVARNISHKVRVKDRNQVMIDFKKVYQSNDFDSAKINLESFENKWRKVYPKMIEILQKNQYLLTFYNYPEEIRASIYSTNIIEGFNKHLKRKTKAKIQFPTTDSLEKYLVSLFDEYNLKFESRVHKGFSLVTSTLYQMLETKYNLSNNV